MALDLRLPLLYSLHNRNFKQSTMCESLLKNPISAETLATDAKIRQQVEQELEEKYGTGVANYDPTHDLLEGKHKREMDDYIDQLTKSI